MSKDNTGANTSANTSTNSSPTTLICIPAMDMVPTQFMECLLGIPRPEGTMIATAKSSLVYDARNMLAQMAIEKGYERILWLDSDMVFDGGSMMEMFHADLDAGHRMVTGLAVTRKFPIRPTIYSNTGYNEVPESGGKRSAYANALLEWPKDTLFEVAGTGLAGCMMETSVILDVYEKFGSPFSPEAGFGEDLSFCRRLNELGIPIWCDSRIKLGHIGQKVFTADDYLKESAI